MPLGVRPSRLLCMSTTPKRMRDYANTSPAHQALSPSGLRMRTALEQSSIRTRRGRVPEGSGGSFHFSPRRRCPPATDHCVLGRHCRESRHAD
jgi:hypothetical protein